MKDNFIEYVFITASALAISDALRKTGMPVTPITIEALRLLADVYENGKKIAEMSNEEIAAMINFRVSELERNQS